VCVCDNRVECVRSRVSHFLDINYNYYLYNILLPDRPVRLARSESPVALTSEDWTARQRLPSPREFNFPVPALSFDRHRHNCSDSTAATGPPPPPPPPPLSSSPFAVGFRAQWFRAI